MFWNRQETPKSSASPKSVEEPPKKSLNQLEITERLHNWGYWYEIVALTVLVVLTVMVKVVAWIVVEVSLQCIKYD